jgi:hypothetical protein
MKVSKMKKMVLVMSLGLGFSAAFSGAANAGVNGAICDSLRYKCAAGDENACFNLRLCRNYPAFSIQG